jgi:hypothetical protein
VTDTIARRWEKALFDFLYLSPTRGRPFAAVPELDLSRRYRKSIVREGVVHGTFSSKVESRHAFDPRSRQGSSEPYRLHPKPHQARSTTVPLSSSGTTGIGSVDVADLGREGRRAVPGALRQRLAALLDVLD